MTAPLPDHCLACDANDFDQKPLVGTDQTGNNSGEFDVYSCRVCGSGTTMPFVATENLGSLYEGMYDSYADPVSTGPIGKAFAFYHRVTRWLYQRETPASGVAGRKGQLLEIGCGDGQAGLSFIERGWQAYAVEPSPIAAEVARGRGIDVYEGTLDTYEGDADRFDAVLFRHSLEHVVEPREDLAKVVKFLAPGGKLLIEVPNYGSWQRKRFGADWYGLSLPLHRTHFSADGLRGAVESAGFTVDKIDTGTCPAALPACIQHKFFGRVILHRPGAAGILIWRATQLITYPISRAVDLVMGGGDVLRLVATKTGERDRRG